MLAREHIFPERPDYGRSLRLFQILFLFVLVTWLISRPLSADLLALYLAGHFMDMGLTTQIYPSDTEFFTMLPPDGWEEFAAEKLGYVNSVFPFLYPPLWAKFGQLLAGYDFYIVTLAGFAINSVLILAMIELAHRAGASKLHPAIYTLLALFLLAFTFVGRVAMMENQPQIFVSFLLVLALERDRAGDNRTAGIALALAASIKLYPVLFVLLWIFARNWKAVSSFAVAGALLAGLSVALAGWPLHVHFLQQTAIISQSVLVTPITSSIDGFIGQWFFLDDMTRIDGTQEPTEANPDPGWYTMARPLWWRILSPIVLFGALLWLAKMYRDSDAATRAACIWPLTIAATALLSPISWIYYFIPVLCFAPVIAERLNGLLAVTLLAVSFVPIFLPTVRIYSEIALFGDNYGSAIQVATTLSCLALALGLYLASRVRERVRSAT